MSNLFPTSSFASPVKSQLSSSCTAPTSAPTAVRLKVSSLGTAAAREKTCKISTLSPKKTVGAKQQAAAVMGSLTRRRSLFGSVATTNNDSSISSPKRIRFDNASYTTQAADAAETLPLPVAETSDVAVALLRGSAGRVVEIQLPRGRERVGLRVGNTWTCADLKTRLAVAHSTDFPTGASSITLLTRVNAPRNGSFDHEKCVGGSEKEGGSSKMWIELANSERIPGGDVLIKTEFRPPP